MNALIQTRLAEGGHKFEAHEVSGLHQLAYDFLRDYTGDFDFLVDLKRRAHRGLSDGQVKGVLNCLLADGRREAEAARPVEVLEFQPIADLLNRAKQHLKYPKVRLDGFVIQLAGDRSKAPGSVTVSTGLPYGESQWFARILQDGTLQAGRTPERVLEVLRAFAANPAKVAGEHGRLHGRCCFCNLPLSDERSTIVGYGSTCAAHFELPWGAEKFSFQEAS